MEIQSIAQCGLAYAKDVYDKERYERLREISAEMLGFKTGIPADKVQGLFCNETGYQTPKLDTRAAVFKDGKILLVQENSGTWSLPGGWVDILESVASNTVKEVKEEAGVDVTAQKLIAVLDRNKHNRPVYAYGICKIFVLCRLLGGSFVPNSETIASDYFSLDSLPPLAEEKCSKKQIELCFEAARSDIWEPVFD